MKTKYLISSILILFVLLCTSAFALKGEALQGKVMQVKDGDTVVIAPEAGGQFFICRLYGIDTPETSHGSKSSGQPYGEEAARELKRLILGQTVEVTTTGAKTYNREVCQIKKNGIDINLEMVKIGYAWAYKQYLKRPSDKNGYSILTSLSKQDIIRLTFVTLQPEAGKDTSESC